MQNWVQAAGYAASALVLVTFCMRTMIPLRIAAVCSNLAFIVYGFYAQLYPVLFLHLILLPLNLLRTFQLVSLERKVERAAATSEVSVDWLKPFMKEMRLKAGEMLFRRGDEAERLFMLLHGEIRLVEIDRTLRAGDLFGEIGLFSSDHRRTQTAVAVGDIELLWISETDFARICHQNPAISFYFLRLITHRLTANNAQLAKQVLASA
ncbi:MAG: cyclic nucleotide-binding domain-containing protein [Bradyrhizobium sp.]|nr:cyclic nucleotide-binding domain-containing protein [Bradyrhizobium sp.]